MTDDEEIDLGRLRALMEYLRSSPPEDSEGDGITPPRLADLTEVQRAFYQHNATGFALRSMMRGPFPEGPRENIMDYLSRPRPRRVPNPDARLEADLMPGGYIPTDKEILAGIKAGFVNGGFDIG